MIQLAHTTADHLTMFDSTAVYAGVITKVLHITFIGIFTHQPQAATYNITVD